MLPVHLTFTSKLMLNLKIIYLHSLTLSMSINDIITISSSSRQMPCSQVFRPGIRPYSEGYTWVTVSHPGHPTASSPETSPEMVQKWQWAELPKTSGPRGTISLQHHQHNQGAAGSRRRSLPGHLWSGHVTLQGALLLHGLPIDPKTIQVDVSMSALSPHLKPKAPTAPSLPCLCFCPELPGNLLPDSPVQFSPSRAPRRVGHSILWKRCITAMCQALR